MSGAAEHGGDLGKVVLATANPHKVEEISALLPEVDFVSRPDDVPDVVEDAGTLVGNARLKAVALAEATGLPALADDTGLFVDALDGAPGVEAAYFAGPDATYAARDVVAFEEVFRTAGAGQAFKIFKIKIKF